MFLATFEFGIELYFKHRVIYFHKTKYDIFLLVVRMNASQPNAKFQNNFIVRTFSD